MHHFLHLAAVLLGAATVPSIPQTGDTAAVRRATEEVRAGLGHADAGRMPAAVAAYGRAAELVPAFAPWAHVLSASAAARSGDTAAVRRHLSATDADLAREWGWRARSDAASAAGDSRGAAVIAAAAAAEVRDPARRVQAWARAGTLHGAAARNSDAAAALRSAIDESTAFAASVDAARLLGSLPNVTPEDQRRIGRVYLRHRNLSRAAMAFDAYLASSQPTASERAAIQLDLGRAYFESREYPLAEQRLRLAANVAGGGETAADAAHLLGRTLYRQGRTADARAAFLRVTRDFAGTGAAARAHFVIADIDHDAGRVESAKTHYRAVVEAGGPDAALSAARLGGFALLENRPREAARVYEDAFQRADGRARQKPGYWWAHALELAGAADSARLVLREVRAEDPFSYYGLRAGERLGVGLWEFESAPVPAVTADVHAEVARRLDALDVLRGAGLDESANLEAARVMERFAAADGALYALAAGYHARDQTFSGIRIGRELLRREGNWNRELLQLVYPFPYRDAVIREARANNLDPYLVAGLIRQESMFNTRARSPAGAIGLMQVMPRTGTTVARTVGIQGFQPARLTDPAVNLRIGTRYLAEQIRSHNGRLVDAIGAYNAGPHRIARWRQFPEYRIPELFIERIPFQETRDYVKIVQQNAVIYRELYGLAAP
ncbi:MAG TPA: transglycosylase SLT domain-containing protein [Longimicrobiales bacterium]|nr:transglycosylase SLT domain-containing protein [Longimicrobiales bacterium]